jgi:hypothetical protein
MKNDLLGALYRLNNILHAFAAVPAAIFLVTEIVMPLLILGLTFYERRGLHSFVGYTSRNFTASWRRLALLTAFADESRRKT